MQFIIEDVRRNFLNVSRIKYYSKHDAKEIKSVATKNYKGHSKID